MTLRWIATLALLIALPLVAAGDTQRKWKLVSDRDGIQIYMAHNDDSRIKTFRGVTVLEMDDFYSNIALLDDYEFYSRWLYLISELSEVGRRSPVDRDVLVRTKLPFVANRDAGLHLTVEQNPQTLEINIRFRAKEGIIPVDPDYVRIPEMEGHFSSKPLGGKKVQMTFEVLLDPGGSIPAFLANFILKDIPLNSLQRFRRVINTERFANHSADYIVLPEGWRQPQSSPQTP